MVQTDNDDVFVHALFEPASMPAGEERIPPKKIAEDDAEPEHGKQRCLLAAKSCSEPGV